MRPALDFSFARDGRLWKLIYVLLAAALFCFAAARRFSLPLIPILAAAVIIWLLSQATWKELGVEAVVLVIAAAFFLARTRGSRLPQSH